GGALLGSLHGQVWQRTADDPSAALSGGALAPTAGVITGATLAGTLFGSIAPYDPVTIFLAALVGAGLGGVVARWLILRRPVGVAGWGIAATGVSLGVGFFLGYGLGGGGGDVLVACAPGGVVGGRFQLRCPRRAS